ncbi:MAG: D-2-hydroxyacid dehydrogenase [Gammaproteobacteria bacterium]|nr:D-2-hydroxyacid dehydrogenase [Gammaproteobacteria bacterium]
MTHDYFHDIKKGVVLDLDSLNNNDLNLDKLEQCLPNWTFYGNTKPEEVDSRIANADIVVSNKVVLGKDTLSHAKQIKLICIAATGTNNVDLNAAKKYQIPVCNITHYATHSVPEHVFRLILSLNGRLIENNAACVQGMWSQSPYFCLLNYPPQDLNGKTIGIIGYGDLGQAVAKIAKTFDMKVLIAKRDNNDRREGRLSLNDLLPQVDILSLHCPLTEDNFQLISSYEFSLLPEHALLINTARGPLVDEEALLTALQKKQIAGAGLDVLAEEPPAVDHPLLNCGLNNLIITPHIAWASQQSRQRLVDQLADNILAFKEGKPRNLV